MAAFQANLLITPRLTLVSATVEHVRAELQARSALAHLLRAEVGPDWPPGEYDRDAQEFFLARLEEGGAAVTGWYAWYAILRARGSQSAVVGAGGYFGPPSKGEAEIGFSMLPARRELGYATEMVEVLVRNAFADLRVQRVVARTAPTNIPCRKVLAKCGFSVEEVDENGLLRHVVRRAGARPDRT